MSNVDRRSLLVTGDEFHASLALVRGLRFAGYRPVLAVSRDDTYAARSRAVAAVVNVPDPEANPERFAFAVGRAATTARAAAVLPGTEASLLALARWRQQAVAPVGVPDVATVELATYKQRVLEIAATCGLYPPPSLAGTPVQLAARANETEYPAILKPPRTRLELSPSRFTYFSVARVESPEQLRETLRDLPEVEWVLQQNVQGELCAVSGVAWRGEIVCAVHQVANRIWPPKTGYSCYAETVAPDRELEAQTAKLLRSISWSGIFQLQLMCGEDGRRWIIDFNPRAYGSLSLAVRAGANLPAIWAALELGDPLPPTRYRSGTRYRMEPNDARAIARAVRRHGWRALPAAIRPRRRTVHAIFSLRDPGPAVLAAGKMLRRVAS